MKAFGMAKIPLHHMIAENYCWLGQVSFSFLPLFKNILVILVSYPQHGKYLDYSCTLVDGTVLEQLVLFTLTICGGMEEGKKEFCYIFHCQYFRKEKDVMDPFTASKQDIHSQIFWLKLETWEKKEGLYDSFFSL